MTGPSLDLDALREWSTLLHRSPIESERALAADLDAVLALVEEQRKENERLRYTLDLYRRPT